ncbi:hypothetical protein [Streptomyces sp. WP-1]|uniref:hypothetical protein n=1 Tax=Streptomyces sp. WP-1 TaxID=3041497 RepID=UPI002647834C|nr:hypothetical protein [Streptomyces sp. WP-1]WKE71143.1 hypothetical protein QHG49_19985 [Streptomyces sp. WP-1]
MAASLRRASARSVRTMVPSGIATTVTVIALPLGSAPSLGGPRRPRTRMPSGAPPGGPNG